MGFFSVRNVTAEQLKLVIEPWAEVEILQPGAAADFAYSDDPPAMVDIEYSGPAEVSVSLMGMGIVIQVNGRTLKYGVDYRGKERPMTEMPAIVTSLRDAINRGDWPGFAALFAPDPVVDDWGDSYAGLAAIKAWSDREVIGAKGTLTITRIVAAEGDTIAFDTDWTSSFFSGPGRFTLTLRDGKIGTLRISES